MFKIKTKEIVAELKKIEERDGLINPKMVVDEARNSQHPLHPLFDWDDRIAAEKYRLQQARMLINTVRVELLERDTQAFQNVVVTTVDNQKVRGYISTEKALSQADLHYQVIDQALAEIEHWQQKYEELAELSEIINQEQISKLRQRNNRGKATNLKL